MDFGRIFSDESLFEILNNSSSFDFRSIFFNVISSLTGTGYVNAQFDNWGSFPIVLFLVLMFIGGCAGSTTSVSYTHLTLPTIVGV